MIHRWLFLFNRSLNESLRLLLLLFSVAVISDRMLRALKDLLLVRIVLTQIVIHLGEGALDSLVLGVAMRIKLLMSKLL